MLKKIIVQPVNAIKYGMRLSKPPLYGLPIYAFAETAAPEAYRPITSEQQTRSPNLAPMPAVKPVPGCSITPLTIYQNLDELGMCGPYLSQGVCTSLR